MILPVSGGYRGGGLLVDPHLGFSPPQYIITVKNNGRSG